MFKFLGNTKVRIIVIVICIGVIIYESIGLYKDNKEYDIAETEYEKLVEESITPLTPEENEIFESIDYPAIHVKYSQLESINSDFVAWLYFPYLDINYPVVHENEIDEYLKKTFDGTRNISGCLFTDILSTEDFSGMHDIIFGHNMRNGSMFGKFKELNQTEEIDLLKNNPYIYLYTENNVFQYEIFAYYITTVGSDAYSVVTNDEEYDNFLKYATTNSIYNPASDLDMSKRPPILTLSTCSGKSGSGRRFVIHAAKINTWQQ